MTSKCVAVVGLGYVGLPLAIAFSEAGFKVIGLEQDLAKVNALRSGFSFLEDISSSRLLEASSRGLEMHSSPVEISNADLVIVTVPTPLDESGTFPDLTLVLRAAEDVRRFLKHGVAVCLESTVAPGTTEGPFLAALSANGLRVDHDFFLGFSPERINPGMPTTDFLKTPKLISGVTNHSLSVILEFYSCVFDRLVPVRGVREAEFAKLLENSYRLVNISFVTELAYAAKNLGIDFAEVIRAAKTKPFGFQPFYPTAGIGGHCIPVDPVYLRTALEESTGFSQEVLGSAIRVNENSVKRFLEEIIGGDSAVRNKSVLVAGLSYKKGVRDTRNSASLNLIRELTSMSADVFVYDELVRQVNVEGFHYQSIDLDSHGPTVDIVVLMHDFSSEEQSRLVRLANRAYSAHGFLGAIASSESALGADRL